MIDYEKQLPSQEFVGWFVPITLNLIPKNGLETSPFQGISEIWTIAEGYSDRKARNSFRITQWIQFQTNPKMGKPPTLLFEWEDTKAFLSPKMSQGSIP